MICPEVLLSCVCECMCYVREYISIFIVQAQSGSKERHAGKGRGASGG
jgi:hypothetical protein